MSIMLWGVWVIVGLVGLNVLTWIIGSICIAKRHGNSMEYIDNNIRAIGVNAVLFFILVIWYIVLFTTTYHTN